MTTLKTIAARFVPSFLMRYLDPASYAIAQFVFRASHDIAAGARVLDAGAGEAPFRNYFTRHSYVAVDTGCGDRTWDYSRIDVQSDLAHLPFEACSFDAVICTQVLEHVAEPALVLAELARVTVPGGTIYLSAPQGWGLHQAPHDYFRFTCYGLKYLFEKAGFTVVSLQPSCGYFGYLANRLTVLPKVLFWRIRTPAARVVLFPLELVISLLFFVVVPVVLNSLDFLDKEKDYTLNYFVVGVKR